MPKVKLESVELTDAEVTHISLVKHGANRVPFRIVKQADQEAGMIDLGDLFKSRKSEATKPHVVALVVEKSEHQELVSTILSESGFLVDKAEEREDGTVVFKQVDGDINFDECQIVKMSDDLLIVTKGFNCWDTVRDLSFMEQINAQSFFPSMYTASDVLRDQVHTILKEADGPTGKTTQELTTLLDDFKSYVLAQVEAIPAKAFKAEAELAEKLSVAKAAKAEAGDKPPVHEPAAAAGEENTEAVVEKSEQEGQTSVEGDGAAAAVVADAPAAEPSAMKMVEDGLKSVQETVTKLADLLATSMQSVTKQVSELGEQVNGLKEQGESLATKLGEVEGVAKSAESAVKGKLVMAPPTGDTPPKEGVVKQEEDPRQGLFDTAYMPGRFGNNRRAG